MRVQIVPPVDHHRGQPGRRWHLAIASFALHALLFRPLATCKLAFALAASGLVTLPSFSSSPLVHSMLPFHQHAGVATNPTSTRCGRQLEERDESDERRHPGPLASRGSPQILRGAVVTGSAQCMLPSHPLLRSSLSSLLGSLRCLTANSRQDRALLVKPVFILLPGK